MLPHRRAALACMVLLAVTVVWTVLTESLFIIHNPGLDVFEFIERSGDYFAPIAMIFLIQLQSKQTANAAAPAPG